MEPFACEYRPQVPCIAGLLTCLLNLDFVRGTHQSQLLPASLPLPPARNHPFSCLPHCILEASKSPRNALPSLHRLQTRCGRGAIAAQALRTLRRGVTTQRSTTERRIGNRIHNECPTIPKRNGQACAAHENSRTRRNRRRAHS